MIEPTNQRLPVVFLLQIRRDYRVHVYILSTRRTDAKHSFRPILKPKEGYLFAVMHSMNDIKDAIKSDGHKLHDLEP